jgi:hypothetical protein
MTRGRFFAFFFTATLFGLVAFWGLGTGCSASTGRVALMAFGLVAFGLVAFCTTTTGAFLVALVALVAFCTTTTTGALVALVVIFLGVTAAVALVALVKFLTVALASAKRMKFPSTSSTTWPNAAEL